MARTSLTVQEPTRIAQVTLTANAVDAANGNRFVNDGKTFLEVTNGSGGSLTVTIQMPQLYDTDLTISDRTYTIANGANVAIGPWPTSYNTTYDSVSDSIGVDWSTGTSVTVKVIRITAV